jgi:hypothetical protein
MWQNCEDRNPTGVPCETLGRLGYEIRKDVSVSEVPYRYASGVVPRKCKDTTVCIIETIRKRTVAQKHEVLIAT